MLPFFLVDFYEIMGKMPLQGHLTFRTIKGSRFFQGTILLHTSCNIQGHAGITHRNCL